MSGMRDPRFVAQHRGGNLDPADHRRLAQWAAACAERVLPLFESASPLDERPRLAVDSARAWGRGELEFVPVRNAALGAHAAARAAPTEAAVAVARAAGHAAATAHMADHSLGGAGYAIRALRAATAGDAGAAVLAELEWQEAQLPESLAWVMEALERRDIIAGIIHRSANDRGAP